MNQLESFDYSQIAGVVRRRWLVAAWVAGALFLASIVVAALLPDRYQASTTLLVEPQTVSRRLVDGGLQDADLENRLHLMTMQILQRSRLSRIIDEFGLYPDLEDEMTREEVISVMRDDIQIVPVVPELTAGSRRNRDFEINTFMMQYMSDSPETAAAVANRLASDFIDQHLKERVQVSGDTAAFISTELDRLSSRMQEAESQLAAVKNENQGSLPEDMRANQERLARIAQELHWAQRDLAVTTSDEAFYRQQVATGALEKRHWSQPDTPADRKERLELALGEYRSRGLTDKHPDVIAAQAELSLLEERLEASSEAQSSSLSPSQLLSQNEAKRAEIQGLAARKQVEALSEQAAELEARLSRTPRVAEQLAALEREYEHLYKTYQEFSAKRMEANVAADMERNQKGEQFRILEVAFPPAEPSSPNRPLIVVIGLFFSAIVGVGIATLLEVVDTSFHGARQLQSLVPIPVLATIPRTLMQSERVALRRRRMATLVLAASLTLVTLFGAGVGYLVVQRVPEPVQGDAATRPPAELGG